MFECINVNVLTLDKEEEEVYSWRVNCKVSPHNLPFPTFLPSIDVRTSCCVWNISLFSSLVSLIYWLSLFFFTYFPFIFLLFLGLHFFLYIYTSVIFCILYFPMYCFVFPVTLVFVFLGSILVRSLQSVDVFRSWCRRVAWRGGAAASVSCPVTHNHFLRLTFPLFPPHQYFTPSFQHLLQKILDASDFSLKLGYESDIWRWNLYCISVTTLVASRIYATT